MKVRYFATAESGPFAELEDGRRVYGLCGAAPYLLAALEQIISEANKAPETLHDVQKRRYSAWAAKIAQNAVHVAIAKMEPCSNHFSDGSKIFPQRDCCSETPAVRTFTGFTPAEIQQAREIVSKWWTEYAHLVYQADNYAPHVTEDEKQAFLSKELAFAQSIATGALDDDFTVRNRIYHTLTLAPAGPCKAKEVQP